MTERVLDYWLRALKSDGSANALIESSGRVFSRREVEKRSLEIAELISDCGVRKGECLVLCLPNGLDWMGGFLACLRLGVVMIFADYGTSSEDLERISGSTRSRGIWNGKTLFEKRGHAPRRFRDSRIILGKLTSGSTGLPRCLFFKDSEMIADGERTSRALGYGRKDRLLGLVPWGHAYGLGTLVLPFLIHASELIALQSPLPSDIVRVLETWKPTVFPAVPTILSVLVRSDCPQCSFGSLRVLVTAGSRLDPEIAQAMERQYGVIPLNLYGSSETGSIACDARGEATKSGRSVGQPLEGVMVSESRDGRIRVRSPMVFTYGNRGVDTSGDGVCLVGDYGYLDQNGELVLKARAKGFVKVGEKRIGLADVERRLKSIPGVTAALAFGFEDGKETLIAAALQSDRSKGEISRAVRQQLPGKFRPRRLLVLEQLPVTDRGKVSESALRTLLEEQSVS